MKRPTMLLERVLLDVGLQLSDTIDRDYREICSRYKDEGMSFLAITLPRLDDALLRGLSNGRLTPQDFEGFRPRRRGGSLPALLQGFFRRIFDDDGWLLRQPDTCAIYAIRQVTRLFKKVELPCSDARVKAAYERYVSNDQEVDWRRGNIHRSDRLWRSICGILWSGLEVFGSEVYLRPGRFGPGATAESLGRNARHDIREWPERSEGSFPSSFHAVPREDSDALLSITYLSQEDERPVRVVQVPKTLKTPRTISVEPSYMMLMQQSVAKPLMMYLESPAFGFKSIRFTDQSVNRSLARLGSLDGSLSTIDLKDASDLVDLDLVRDIFAGPCPTFLQLIEDCRSTRAQLPDGSILPLRKFASMGSAMCFPIEAMVFFTIIMYALVKSSGSVPSRRNLLKLASDVAVYGDDIIVPSSMAPDVMDCLEAFGLKVNQDKSFHTGLFRESCGGDYYKGVDVTPAYVRHWDDSGTLSDSSLLVAYVSLSNTFYTKGLWHACQSVREHVSRRIGQLPLARQPIGCLHFTSFRYDSNLSYDSKFHAYRVKGVKVRTRLVHDPVSSISGHLSLSFHDRAFSSSMRDWEDRCSRLAADIRKSSALFRRSGFLEQESHDDEISRKCERGYDISSGRRLYGLPGRRPYGRSFGIREALYGRDYHGDPLEHLSQVFLRSHDTSERPHALCLKRGWTASRAGLAW